MHSSNCAPVLTTATEEEFAMPDTRTSDASSSDQAMTIPERVKAALKAAGRFEVGSEVYLPDHNQTLRVIGVDFTSSKGRKATIAWLRWESECVECGKRYQFTSKRTFTYPTRTCPDHRRTARRKIARVAPKDGGAVPLRKAVFDAMQGLSLFSDVVSRAEIEQAVLERLPSAKSKAIWDMVFDVADYDYEANKVGVYDDPEEVVFS